jgi:IS5 family transposase
MATENAKAVYKHRGAIAEWTNAQIRQHGLSRFTVRGIAKVTTVMLLIVIAHNILQWAALRG